MEFELKEISPRLHRVTLRGRGDAASIDKIETDFTAALADLHGGVLVDMTAVTFIGSLGIRMLCREARVLARRHDIMVLYGVPPLVMEVFDAMQLAELIPIATDEAAARAVAAR
jgi:anti-anti-sigma factor